MDIVLLLWFENAYVLAGAVDAVGAGAAGAAVLVTVVVPVSG